MYELLPADWRAVLEPGLTTPEQQMLAVAVDEAYRHERVYPPHSELFTAFELTPFSAVRVIILGQDPYHTAGRAHGLAFSVRDGVAVPPSLKNILTEVQHDVGTTCITSGDLTPWTKQGVLLLNTVLTVRSDEANSHRSLGWEIFTSNVISTLSTQRNHLVFLLWGAHAKETAVLVDATKHLVLTTTHPSPLSAHRGFLGCRHFSQTNSYLTTHGFPAIKW